ncbi:MAG TPA: hypothetical protein VHG92_13900 [Afifellaceae bacterium]|nr:hypothetical protein [Afifellaceae bacterium]
MSQAVHVIHENPDWSEPLFRALEERVIPYADWFIDDGALDMTRPPPDGIFYNRMSASSHTRGHRYAPEMTGGLLAWLAAWGRTVVNGPGAIRLELAKTIQYAAMRAHGLPFPPTIAAISPDAIVAAWDGLGGGPAVTKHNRAGKGLGVHLFRSRDDLEAYVRGPAFEPSVDGITLVQRYIEAPEPFIVRIEFIGGEPVYAVRVDTSEGFELCPADVCEVPGAAPSRPKFEIIDGFSHPLVPAMRRLLADNDAQVAAFEFITDRQGRPWFYDINTNTNYNPDAERRAGVSAMARLADFLGGLARARAA